MIVCTVMWGDAWENYGHKFAETFTEYWDHSIDIVTVVDKSVNFKRSHLLSLTLIEDYTFFKDRMDIEPIVKKCNPVDKWKYNTMKWIPQVVTPKAVLYSHPHWKDGDILVWLDADTETHSKVTPNWVEKVLGDYDIACLQRKNLHTEIGFYAMRLSNKTRNILVHFVNLYTSYEIFKYNVWHSAYAWDIAVSKEKDVTIKNLTNKSTKSTHVFETSILAEKLTHKKGNRKPGEI